MNAEQLSKEVYSKLVNLEYTRKPNSFEEATQTNFNSLPAEIKEAINSFPQSYVDLREDLMDIDSLEGDQQFYLFTNENGFYLVDTQGYNYPRYITQLVNFEEQGDTFERMDGLVRIADVTILQSAVKSLVFDLEADGFTRADIINFIDAKVYDAILEK